MELRSALRSAIAGSAFVSAVFSSADVARASDAPSFTLMNDAITVKPYILNQFDLGGAWGPSDQNPTGGLNTRRLRYGLEMKLPEDIAVRVIWDFGNSGYGWPQYRSTGLYEAALHYKGLQPITITAGAFAPNLTLEGGQRSADKLFATDPAIINLIGASSVNGGQLGVQVSADGPRWLLEATITGGQIGDSSTARQRALLARAAGLVVRTSDLAVHLGVSSAWSFRTPQQRGSQPGIEFATTPEYDIQGRSTIDTDTIPASGTFGVGPEVGLTYGPLWIQGEWYRTQVDRTTDTNPSFSGWYAQVGWTLLGKPRQWRSEAGSWGAPAASAGFNPSAGDWGRWKSVRAFPLPILTQVASTAASRASGPQA